MSKERIEKILPHREPFLLVDEIIEIVPGVKAKALKHVKLEEYYFKGHFPEKPVMPGVLIVEALAQVGGLAILENEEYEGKLAYLVGIDKFKFRKVVEPGDTLVLECEVSKFKRGFGYGYGKAYVKDELACEGKISFAIR